MRVRLCTYKMQKFRSRALNTSPPQVGYASRDESVPTQSIYYRNEANWKGASGLKGRGRSETLHDCSVDKKIFDYSFIPLFYNKVLHLDNVRKKRKGKKGGRERGDRAAQLQAHTSGTGRKRGHIRRHSFSQNTTSHAPWATRRRPIERRNRRRLLHACRVRFSRRKPRHTHRVPSIPRAQNRNEAADEAGKPHLKPDQRSRKKHRDEGEGQVRGS